MRRSDDSQNVPVPHSVFPRQLYFFYDKNSGVSHFNVQAEPDGSLPVEQAAGLLAMHCLVRGQSPDDYVVMIEAEKNALQGLKEKAETLLKVGHSVTSSIKLTRREEEVLGGVMRSLANKEIASALNLSERTVKFHVSSLLAKFGVRGRMELAREASQKALPSGSMPAPAAIGTHDFRNSKPQTHGYRVGPRRASVVPLANPRLMA
jgi:DNA-binding CsgD family transcriptional regulator